MIKIGYVTVLDNSKDEIHIYKFFLRENEMENFIKSKGHDILRCSFMITEELKLTIH